MFEPNKNESKSVTSTKPVEIYTDLTNNSNQVQLKKEELRVPSSLSITSNQVNETSSYSAYASAESSPNQNSLLASAESANQLRTHSNPKSATSSSSSLNSYLTIDNSKLMDDLASAMLSTSGRATPTNKEATTTSTTITITKETQSINNTTSEPFYEITPDHVNKNFLEDEFQSLPPSFIDETKQIKTSITTEQINFNLIDNDLVNVNLKQTRKSISNISSTITDIINKEVKSQLTNMNTPLDSSLDDKSNPPTPTQATTSPTSTSSLSTKQSTIKTTAMAFLNLFKNSDKTSTESTQSQSKPINVSPLSELNKPTKPNEANLSASKLVTSAITSASSPNPDCSPYKLLINELPSNKHVVVNDFNSRAVNKTQTIECKENQPCDKPNLIESLASLNHKESDKIDPILTGAAATTSQNDKKDEDNIKTTVDQSVSVKNEIEKVDHVPASSHEFCMNLNFNLAAAAAATAAGPVVVESMKASPEHIRYTSNASTSSIHNDLKLILEESKDTNKISTQTLQQQQQPQSEPPKPQRVPRTKSNEKKTTNPTAETSSNFIKMMLNMVEANKQQISTNKHHQEPKLISWPKKENGRYRYTKEFLKQINEQRAEFIDQIYPDVFKAYCYCMNGKYWDPEKYFDISEYDKIPMTRNNRNYNNNNNSNNTPGYQPKNQQQNQQRRRNISSSMKYDNNKSKDLQTPSTSVLSTADSPQPLQVPKNSPKVTIESNQHSDQQRLNLSTSHQKNSNKENKKKLNNILSTLGVDSHSDSVKHNEADRFLLSLIKNKESKQSTNKCDDLLQILNTKKEQFELERQHMSNNHNILDNLFPNKTSPQQQVVPQMPTQTPRHYPTLLTAQELEMSQLLTQQKPQKPKLPNATSDLNRFDDLNNTSDAYKQLVKNLNNHPLNASSSLIKISQEQRYKQQQQQQQQHHQQQQWSNDGTNVLRQLLNLNPDNSQNNKSEKKNKKKHTHNHHNHHHHHHQKTKSPSSSMLTSNQIESIKFPVQNPHEKPFENYFGTEEINKDNKHAEIVVASTLNHVLNKSPSFHQKNTIENLFEKMNMQQQQKKKITKSENDHFNSLLNKMMPQTQHLDKKQTETSSDILKWFTGSAAAQVTTTLNKNNLSPNVLSEIEFMEMHQPKVLSKLY